MLETFRLVLLLPFWLAKGEEDRGWDSHSSESPSSHGSAIVSSAVLRCDNCLVDGLHEPGLPRCYCIGMSQCAIACVVSMCSGHVCIGICVASCDLLLLNNTTNTSIYTAARCGMARAVYHANASCHETRTELHDHTYHRCMNYAYLARESKVHSDSH